MLLLDLARCRGTRLLNCSNEKADLFKDIVCVAYKAYNKRNHSVSPAYPVCQPELCIC